MCIRDSPGTRRLTAGERRWSPRSPAGSGGSEDCRAPRCSCSAPSLWPPCSQCWQRSVPRRQSASARRSSSPRWPQPRSSTSCTPAASCSSRRPRPSGFARHRSACGFGRRRERMRSTPTCWEWCRLRSRTGTPRPASGCLSTSTATEMRWRASGCARRVCCCSSAPPPAASPGPPTRWPVAAAPGAWCSPRWRPQGLRQVLDDLDVLSRLEPPVRLILWLDRVDTFAPGGITAELLRRCRQRSPGLWVVATISTTRYKTWATEEASVAAEFGEPVTLERLPSPSELDRAQATYPDVDFSEGIAAAFTAVGALLVRLRAGDGDCPYESPGGDCPVARAVVSLATGWATTGTSRPLPVALLAGLVQQRLGRAEDLDHRHLARALEWACAPTLQGARLLRPAVQNSRDAVRAHPEVAEIRAAEEPPSPAVWAAVLDEAVTADDSEAIGRIGFQAHVAGEAGTATLVGTHRPLGRTRRGLARPRR